MKKQKTQEEKEVRKAAIEATLGFLIMVVVIEIVTMLIFSKTALWSDESTQCCIVLIIILDIAMTVFGYFDIKNQISEAQKEFLDEQKRNKKDENAK